MLCLILKSAILAVRFWCDAFLRWILICVLVYCTSSLLGNKFDKCSLVFLLVQQIYWEIEVADVTDLFL